MQSGSVQSADQGAITNGLNGVINEQNPRPRRLRVVESNSHDVYLNLAFEQQLYHELETGDVVLFLWRNAPSVVIGRHQNPWRECDLDAMAAEGVLPARRASGGGAVYHDPGNGNFTFLANSALYQQELHFAVVIAALAEHGIHAHRSGRNDILVGERKISGNAFRHQKAKSYHHGTLLISADLDRLTRYLNPEHTAITRSSGIESVRSRVANLGDLAPGFDWPACVASLTRSAERAYGVPAEIETIDEHRMVARAAVARRRTMYSDWRWIYGRTPDFTRVHRIDGDEVAITVHRGVIVDLTATVLNAAATGPNPAPAGLAGVRYRPEDLNARAHQLSGSGARLCRELVQQLAACGGVPITEEEIE
ncbi:MAG: lipoate--protein ligase [Spirochaetaceae bacterium]|nr:MAG: lipoate--protein ligase [Spirochaetaceae bacterium]